MITTIKCHNCGKEIYYSEIERLNWIRTRFNKVYCPNCLISLYTKLIRKTRHKGVKNAQINE